MRNALFWLFDFKTNEDGIISGSTYIDHFRLPIENTWGRYPVVISFRQEAI